jgi:hypothetical protein
MAQIGPNQDKVSPLWQYMGQQAPTQSAPSVRNTYARALEGKRKRQQAKVQTKQNEAQILPAGQPQVQPFGSYIGQQAPAGAMPWNVMSRRY